MKRTLLAFPFALALACPVLAAAAPPATCEVKATGALSFESSGPASKGSFGSDYWVSDEELRMALKMMAGIGSSKKLTDEEKAKKVDEQMKGDPRFMLFLLNCQTEKVNITFGPSGDSKYKDVPMKPKTYVIGNQAGGKPGDMTVMLMVKNDKGFWRAQPGGKLEVTAFDRKHIAGSFDFTVREGIGKGGPEAKLTGSFDFPCTASKICEK